MKEAAALVHTGSFVDSRITLSAFAVFPRSLVSFFFPSPPRWSVIYIIWNKSLKFVDPLALAAPRRREKGRKKRNERKKGKIKGEKKGLRKVRARDLLSG